MTLVAIAAWKGFFAYFFVKTQDLFLGFFRRPSLMTWNSYLELEEFV